MSQNIDTNALKDFYQAIEAVKVQCGGKVLSGGNWKDVALSQNLKPCQIHVVQRGKNCRTCKDIQNSIDTISRPTSELPHKDSNKQSDLISGEASRHFNSLLRENIKDSAYYKKVLAQMTSFPELIKELKTHHDTFEPWVSLKRGEPSKFWSILYRCIELQVSLNAVEEAMSNSERSEIFVLCFVYIRFAINSSNLLEVFNKFIENPKQVKIDDTRTSCKELIYSLLQSYKFKGMILPPMSLANARKIRMQQLSN